MRRLLWSAIAALAIAMTALAGQTPASADHRHNPGPPDLGPNVLIFDPGMPIGQIQSTVDAITAQQVDSEMSTQRYTLLFKPGVYGSVQTPLILQVGYYTEVAGLGASPADVTIHGHVDVYNRCLTPDNCIALVNFWRSLSNLTIEVAGLSDCRASANFWAVSQAAPMRRVNVIGGNLSLMDYCTGGPQFASGGFIADSQTGFVINGSQQQFIVRDSSVGGWSNGVWNQVFSGVVGAPPQSFGSTPFDPPPYTTLDVSPVTRERPFLFTDAAGALRVFVPALRRDSAGTTWGPGSTPAGSAESIASPGSAGARSTPAGSAESIASPGSAGAGSTPAGSAESIDRFFVAHPTDSARKINSALDDGKHLLLTPGIYHLDRPLEVRRNHTIVLGLGFATLVPDRGNAALTVDDARGVILAGVLIDAGPKESEVLLQVGDDDRHGRHRDHDCSHGRRGDADDPTSLHDVFFRIGGATPGKARLSLVINDDNVILDDIWAWRADHGNGVGWTANTARTGVVVNGDDVTAYGLFVEHYQRFNVIWNGERGRTIMFQNELPYDPPSQADWSHDGINGFAAYKVDDDVKTHEAWGMGSYSFFNVGPDIHAAHAFEVPVTPGVKLHDILSVFLNANGGIDHVVNDTGAPVKAGNQVTNIVSFP